MNMNEISRDMKFLMENKLFAQQGSSQISRIFNSLMETNQTLIKSSFNNESKIYVL